MIQRKVSSLGDVTGYYDTDSNQWVEEQAYDQSTDEHGNVLDDVVADGLVAQREEESAEEVAELEEEDTDTGVAADADDKGEPVDYQSWTKDQLKAKLTEGGIVWPQNATKDQLIALVQAEAE